MKNAPIIWSSEVPASGKDLAACGRSLPQPRLLGEVSINDAVEVCFSIIEVYQIYALEEAPSFDLVSPNFYWQRQVSEGATRLPEQTREQKYVD